MTSREALAVGVIAAPAIGAALVALCPRRVVTAVATVAAVATCVLAVALAAVALTGPADPFVGDWLVVDAAAGLLVGVIGTVGLASVLVSPAYLGTVQSALVRAEQRVRTYYALLLAFWAILLAVPLAGNLAGAWLLVEATTAVSAVLVGFSGRPRALEAGWKYLILTTLGLGVALLGIVLLAAGTPGGGLETLSWRELGTFESGADTALVAYVLLLAGLAAKIGWAPVHNWLPDAHAEAPPPVSALLSAVLLPAVLLVAWRAEQSLAPVVGIGTAQSVLIGFGLVSLAVAVPFLWRALAWKRLLAYSSLEHMGVIALGIGFATPLALAGVAIHITAHAAAKALGFYAAVPLLGHEPRAAGHSVTGVARTQPVLGASMGVSLGVLAGLPPFPLFVSEVLIVAGGFDAGRGWAAGAAALLLALGFLGLAHSLIETTIGKPYRRDPAPGPWPPRRRRAHRRLHRAAARAQRRRALASGKRARRRPPRGGRMTALAPDVYRDAIAAALANGWRFGGLHAAGGEPLVRVLLAAPDGATRLETAAPRDRVLPSIVDLAPAADWDEREAADLYGLRFEGHEPLRPLVDHDLDLARWTVPVRGHDAYQVAVGPIHAGVIESGHFRFHVVGDRILHLDARLFYKHRGLERAAEGSTLEGGLAYAARACAACAVTNGVAYAHACEEALGLEPTTELARARTILLELERMWSHFNDIAAVCAGVGLAAGNNRFAALTERARRLNATLTGHRFLFGTVRVGGSDLALDREVVRAAREEIGALRTESASAWRELLFNASFQDRLPDIGVAHAEDAARLGAVGPGRARGRARGRRPAGKQAPRVRRLRTGRPETRRGRRPRPLRAARARAPPDLRPPRAAARLRGRAGGRRARRT